MREKIREAAQAVVDAVRGGSYSDYEKELDKYDAIVGQAVEAGMALEEIETIEAEIGFIA